MPRVARLILAGLVVALWGTTALAQDKPAPPTEPQPVAAFDLAEFQGQVVLVDFWASWCVPCRQSLPWLNSMQQKYGEQGLQVVMVNLDRKAGAAAKMAKGIVPGIRQFVDPEGTLAAAYELEGMPSSYLYDRDGKLVSSHIGFLKSEAEAKEKAVQAALKQEGS